MQAADERDRAIFKNKAKPIFAQPDAVILAGGFKSFEIWNLLERPRGLDLLDDFLNPPQQGRVGDCG